jgi:hypothetical protein
VWLFGCFGDVKERRGGNIMNTLQYKLLGIALGTAVLLPVGRLQADELESRVVDRSVAVDEELVPPPTPVAPDSVGPVDDDGFQTQTVYRPVYRRFYRGPVFHRGWGPRYYGDYHFGYYPDYGYYNYGGPRYYRYYGTPRFGYYDYPYGGTARVGPLRFYWR